MDTKKLIQLDETYVLPTYGRFLPCLVEGKGCYATDSDGKRYLDFGAGIGVNSLGWCDEEWASAVSGQASRLQHVSNLYGSEPGFVLAEKLCKRSGAHKVFFANSGTEANEGAIKAARNYSLQKYGQGRSRVLSIQNSFHGRTYGALSATGQEGLQSKFIPMVPGFLYLPANDKDALQQELAKGDVCAIMIEPIQGEGGVLPFATEFLQTVNEACSKQDVLIIADEIQTGVGRVGTFLASDLFGLTPDMVTLAKGLGGGLPIGAILFNQKTASSLGKGDHGTTFGMNPVVAAGAGVVVDRLDDVFLEEVANKGAYLKDALSNLPNVFDVQGAGLMWGFSVKEPLTAEALRKACQDRGLLVLLAKNRVRLLPPLIISKEELQAGIDIIKEVLQT